MSRLRAKKGPDLSAPGPSPPPTPPGGGGSYPLGVQGSSAEKLRLQAAWDTKDNAGLSQTTTSSTSVNGAPAGWSKGGGFLDGPTGTWSLSRWKFDDVQLLPQGIGTFSDCEFNNPGSGIINSAVINTGAAGSGMTQLTINDCKIDGTGMQNYIPPSTTGVAAIFYTPNTNMTQFNVNRCHFDKAPLLHLKPVADVTNITDSFFGIFGTDPSTLPPPDNAHMESLFLGRGVVNITGCRIDSSAQNTDPTETMTTAILNVEAKDHGNVEVHLTDTVLAGAKTQGDGTGLPSHVGLSGSAAYTIHIYFQNCAIEKGQIGYIITQASPANVFCHDLGGNVDMDTNAPLTIGINGV